VSYTTALLLHKLLLLGLLAGRSGLVELERL
jgi:hypothetical protein